MASLFQLQVVTPEGPILDEMVEGIILRTTEGDRGILKGHAGHVSAIKAGGVKINTENGPRYGVATEGFIRVGKDVTTVLVTTFEWAGDIDVERAKRSLEKANEVIAKAESPEAVSAAKAKAKKAKVRIETAQIK